MSGYVLFLNRELEGPVLKLLGFGSKVLKLAKGQFTSNRSNHNLFFPKTTIQLVKMTYGKSGT